MLRFPEAYTGSWVLTVQFIITVWASLPQYVWYLLKTRDVCLVSKSKGKSTSLCKLFSYYVNKHYNYFNEGATDIKTFDNNFNYANFNTLSENCVFRQAS